MARPKGTKNIETPERMWELFIQYKEWAKAHPFKVKDWVGGAGKLVTREKERALTMEGFENHLFSEGVLTDAKDYFANKEERYTDFTPICSRIRQTIRQDQIEGGLSGMYNPSITQRLNGLVEKNETDLKVSQFDISMKL